jgi:protein PhnA
MSDDDYVYDEDSGEWVSAAESTAKRQLAAQVEVRDAVGNLLAGGDQVTLVKDLDVKGAGQTLKRGTVIKSIRLTGDPQEIDCRYEGIKGLRATRRVRPQALIVRPRPAMPPAAAIIALADADGRI